LEDDFQDRVDVLRTVIVSALAPLTGLIELLVYKQVVTNDEVVGYVEYLLSTSGEHGDNEKVARAIWLSLLDRIDSKRAADT
jgi:hypothetical protein